MKNYIKFLLKKFLPLYIVLFAVSISFFFVYLTVDTNTYTRPEGLEYYVTKPYSGLLIFIIPLALISIIAPMFANTYRYSIKSVDIFYQTGKGSKQIRFVNNLTMLISVFATYTAAFIIAIIIMFLKQIPNAGKVIVTDYGLEVTYVLFNFGYYLLAYILALISCVVNYFISYFFITRANNPFNSIVCLILGHLLLSILFMTPIWYISIINGLYKNPSFYFASILPATRTLSIISPIAFIANIFESLIISSTPLELVISSDGIFSLVLSIICIICFFAFGGFCIYKFLKEKESSGELAGKPEGRDKLQMIIYHVGAGLIGFWYGIANGLFSSLLVVNVLTTVSSFVMFCALYYVFYSVLRRNFRLHKKDFAILLPVASIYIVSTILYNIFWVSANATI